jgi:cytochrome c oxidase assembly protein subunit 15
VQELRPLYRNFFESVASVQLHHRALALTTVGTTTALWLWLQRRPLPPQLRLATDLLLVGAWAQVRLGVASPPSC